jgi:hypothetical protein
VSLDAWARLIYDEQEAMRFLLREERFETMSIQNINAIQDQALSAFDRVPQSEVAAWMQAIASCEIALQLAKLNESLENISKNLDTFRISGLPIENVGGH